MIAPNQKVPFSRIKELIQAGSTVIDIGCGTGRMAFSIADKCSYVHAIDLSLKNINTALATLNELKVSNIGFHHSDLSSFLKEHRIHFDYAVLSYVIHELSSEERVTILNAASNIADQIIVSDHMPQTTFIAGLIREIVEFGAGPEHYRSYRNYLKEEGLYPLADKCGLTIIKEELHNAHLQIAVLKKNVS
jgi:2-polyprenyl-3-methyl-5-hydroxy-6-metoxy-1,4-benzoquinol methylase